MKTQGESEITIELPRIEPMVEDANRRALWDFALPRGDGLQTSIVRHTVNANKFEIKPFLIQLVQQYQF